MIMYITWVLKILENDLNFWPLTIFQTATEIEKRVSEGDVPWAIEYDDIWFHAGG